jgi:ATP-dependent DNA helicase DinG
LRLPYLDLPALALTGGGGMLARPSGEAQALTTAEARNLIASGDVLICHAMFASQRLNARLVKPLFDLLELFAFVKPGEPCLPSSLGLARALNLVEPHTPEDSARILHKSAGALFDALAGFPPDEKERARKTASFMAKAGWRWGPAVLAVLGEPEAMTSPLAGIDAWRRLAEWEDEPPPARPGSQAVDTEEAQARLTQLIGRKGAMRPLQQDFTAAATAAFALRLRAGSPRIALVEAGTGTGKTLGYLAPASLWAEKNGPGLWISTYTRNLQRQILQESEKLERGAPGRALKVVLRKGRENYLCLLNFEDAAKRNAVAPGQRAVALGLIARWLAVTPDGDFSAAGFPAFLASTVPLRELTDRRGECIYAACPHYRVCFIERGLRRANAADIVIANHALVMAQATHEGLRAEEADDVEPERRVRYVFDEGHHLFDAADSAFAPRPRIERTGARSRRRRGRRQRPRRSTGCFRRAGR